MKYSYIFSIVFFMWSFQSCSDSYLDETPLDFYSPENVLINKSGFEAAIVSLHNFARSEYSIWGDLADENVAGTDVATTGVSDTRFLNDYSTLLPEYKTVTKYWNWAYTQMIKQCNMIIDRAEYPEVKWNSDTEKNEIIAEARFFRAYTYNILVHLYGGVPKVDKEYKEPKFDFDRASKSEILDFIQGDLEFAVSNLPIVASAEGRICRAAAAHLLTEVYLAQGIDRNDASFYDKAINISSRLIDTDEFGHYELMKERFGDTDRPGDVFSDLFWTNQQSRASGNLEVIWAIQYESYTLGGGRENSNANPQTRMHAVQYNQMKTPDGKYVCLNCDSMNRGAGIVTPLDYVKYDIWKDDWNDMRNSSYNIRRDYYYNNPASKDYFGKKVQVVINNGKPVYAYLDGTPSNTPVDTMRTYYPMWRKVEGKAYRDDVTSGNTENDMIKYRLAETYLLRAEAYIRKGDLKEAAEDINEVRGRAKAKLVEPSQVNIDYLLDERARELYVEEPRRLTLSRMGLLYERTIKYNFRAAKTMKPFNALFPIPQKAIDANREVKISQNPGYPGADE